MNGSAVALAAAAGGLLSLERKTIGQLMLSRPIVVAPIVASILGDAGTGFALGVPLELVFLGTSSFGASTPYHETLAALFAASFAVASPALHLGGALHSVPVLPIAFFLSLPFALLGRWFEAGMERWNVGLVDRAEEILASGHPGLATRQAYFGLLGMFVMGAAVVSLGTLLGSAAGDWDENLPHWLERGLQLAWPLALGTSAALAIRAIKTRRSAWLSGIAAVSVFVVFALTNYFDR